jgi:HlyD family secretion protein
VPVTPQPVSSSISLTGKLLPLQMVNLASPISGKVGQVLVRYGDVVKAGQPLVLMDTSEALIKHREAKSAFIKALTNYKQMEKWDTSTDVAGLTAHWQRQKCRWRTRRKHWTSRSDCTKKGSSLPPSMNLQTSVHQSADGLSKRRGRAEGSPGEGEQSKIRKVSAV